MNDNKQELFRIQQRLSSFEGRIKDIENWGNPHLEKDGLDKILVASKRLDKEIGDVWSLAKYLRIELRNLKNTTPLVEKPKKNNWFNWLRR